MLPMHGNEGHSTLSSPLKDCTCTIHPHLLSLSIILYPSPLSRSHDKFCYLQQIWITTLSPSPPPFPPSIHMFGCLLHTPRIPIFSVSLKALSPNHCHFVGSQLLLYSLDLPSDFCLSLRPTSFLFSSLNFHQHY